MELKRYSKDTQKHIKNVIGFIKERYGNFPPEWEINLVMLADNLEMYKRLLEELNNSYYFDSEKGYKNPLLSTIKDTMASIMKLEQKMGLSAYDASRLKVSDSDSADLLSTILGENDDE